jgi:hypothetical protein
MALFHRRETPPADLLALLGKDERVVSWADTPDGAVAATQYGLWWPEAGGHRLIRWQHVDKAVWRDDYLIVVEADVVDDAFLVDRAPVSVRVTVPRDLPPTVRKRVEGNIVERELLSVGGGAVRFVARREPGRDGLQWWARLEPGTPATEATRRAVLARLEKLRARPAAAR